MANGPLGGFMPTPAAPAQPPQVKLDTTADSRGNFNNFLRNMNGALSVDPPVMAPAMGAMAPNMAPSLANIDIFNQPVSMMEQGGNVPPRNTNIMGQPHMLAYITPQEGQLLENLGGANQPGPMGIPSFFDVGEGMGGFGSEDSAVSGGEASSDNDESTVDDDPVAGFDFDEGTGSFDVVSTPTVTEQEQQQNIAEADQFVRALDSSPTTIANANVKFNDLNQNQINEIKSQIDNRNMVALTEEDKFFKDGNLTAAGEAELNKRNTADFQLVSAGQVLPSEYLSTASEILGTGEKSVMDAVNLDKPIDFQEIVANPRIGSPALAGLPTVTSRFNQTKPKSEIEVLRDAVANTIRQTDRPLSDAEKALQQNQLAQQGLNLGPVTFGDDLANFSRNVRDTSQLVGPPEATQAQRVQELLDRGQLAERDKMVQELESIDRERDPLDPTNITRTALGARGQSGTTTTTTLPKDYEENVGLPFSDKRMRDIERLYNVPEGQRRIGEGDDPNILSGIPTALNFLETVPREQMAIDIALGRPRGLGEMIRGFTATPARNMAEFTNRLQRNIADESGETKDFTSKEIPENQLVRNNRGRVIGIKDKSGRLVTGMDPDAPIGGDDSGDPTPIIRPLTPKPEVDKPDLPPNVIGGMGGQLGNLQPIVADTVVASPFAPASSGIQPVTFDSGDLNKLIEMLTGVSARPVVSAKKGGVIGMANGGLIKAVDDFLAAG